MKARLEALVYSFEIFRMFYNTNNLVVRVDGWLGGWMMNKSTPRKIQALCADSKYGVKMSTVVRSKVESKLNSKY